MLTKNNFKCDRFCGKCCIKLTIRVNKSDIKKIKNLGYDENEFLDSDPIDTNKFVLKKKENGHCIFLGKDKEGMFTCKIYDNRPKTCQKYPFFNNKPIESCYPEDLYPNEIFTFNEGKFVVNKQ